MKLITFVVPCYNSQEYLQTCIHSLLPFGEEGEILIINDGSTDETGRIADEYAVRYPAVVRVIHQKNGGHGEGINQGIAHAKGMYLKVVDSDDWLNGEALEQFKIALQDCVKRKILPDVFITNFVYERASDGKSYVCSFAKNFPQTPCGWESVRLFKLWKLLLMHALAYRTELLREHDVTLPKYTFYEDNVFAYLPLAYTKKLYYLNVNLYRYYIGREGQSVAVRNLIKNYEHQLRDFTCIYTAHTYAEIQAMPKGLRGYFKHALKSYMANTLYFTCGEDTPARREALKKLWQDIKAYDKGLYRFLRHSGCAALLMPLPWKLRGALAGWGYRTLCRIVKLGA